MAVSARITNNSADILERFRVGYGKDIDLTLRPAYRDLLEKLGNPHQKLPPVIHVAGTNGKGSVCAYLRAILEAAGHKVHVYTSPHLVRFHERIRIAGKLITEVELRLILEECERLAISGGVSYFEVSTAAAFVAFARHPADFVILETGLGGRLDASNVVDKPLATIITRLSYDHREYLGETLRQIAGEKAGIMRKDVPCFVAHQLDKESSNALREAAEKIHAPLIENWCAEIKDGGFHFHDASRDFDLPLPALLGAHQVQNAGLAIAALSVLQKPLSREDIARGLQTVQWPARLQRLEQGALVNLLPENWELWLDGGHNDSAGLALAAQAKEWKNTDKKPLLVILGMLNTKQPKEFLKPLAPFISMDATVKIPHEASSFSAYDLSLQISTLGIPFGVPCATLQDAFREFRAVRKEPSRILICGSLYLAGQVLSENGTIPE